MQLKTICILMFLLSLSACAVPATQNSPGSAVGIDRESMAGASMKNDAAPKLGATAHRLNPGLTWEYMDSMERDFRQKYAQVKRVIIQRDQNNLSVTLESDVLFDIDSSILKPGSKEELRRLTGVLESYPDTRVSLSVYTDSMGSERHNLELSERRAETVKNSLLENGISSSRLSAHGLGETTPIASNATEKGRQLNRRVTINISPERF